MISLKQSTVPGTQLPSAIGVLWTCPVGATGMLKRITCFNTNTTNEVVTLALVPSGGTPATAHTFIIKTLSPNETYTFIDLEGHVLTQGDTLQGYATTADKVNIFASDLTQT